MTINGKMARLRDKLVMVYIKVIV